jgi:NADH:ubiquinone oxidoreductase subunit 6 (subunit J)
MHIDYIQPLSLAWARMKKALFQPFDITKWFVLGFTAFLADLMDGTHGNGSGSRADFPPDFDEIAAFPYIAWEWLLDHPGWFTLIIIGLVLLLVLGVVLTWLSSRGKFMFLDNVVHNRALVTQPWHDFKTLGDSLFLWRLVFGFIVLCVVVLMIVQFFLIVIEYHNKNFTAAPILTLVGLGLLAFLVIVVIAYISMMLENFIIPIMYKNYLATTKAWHIFLSLFSKYWYHFLCYGLLLFVLWIGIVILIVIAGIFTCCIGFLLLIIPYLGSVILLPNSCTFRAYGPEFLRQFSKEFNIFPEYENTGLTSEL